MMNGVHAAETRCGQARCTTNSAIAMPMANNVKTTMLPAAMLSQPAAQIEPRAHPDAGEAAVGAFGEAEVRRGTGHAAAEFEGTRRWRRRQRRDRLRRERPRRPDGFHGGRCRWLGGGGSGGHVEDGAAVRRWAADLLARCVLGDVELALAGRARDQHRGAPPLQAVAGSDIMAWFNKARFWVARPSQTQGVPPRFEPCRYYPP